MPPTRENGRDAPVPEPRYFKVVLRFLVHELDVGNPHVILCYP